MSNRYRQEQDGVPFEMPKGAIYRIACCDCGLVHDVIVRNKRDTVRVTAWRNNRSTGQRRRIVNNSDKKTRAKI
jgi:uncharacterized Zn finger protein